MATYASLKFRRSAPRDRGDCNSDLGATVQQRPPVVSSAASLSGVELLSIAPSDVGSISLEAPSVDVTDSPTLKNRNVQILSGVSNLTQVDFILFFKDVLVGIN